MAASSIPTSSNARKRYVLTTDHEASHGGIPVLVRDDGAIFGPNDGVVAGEIEARACDFARFFQRCYGFDPVLVERFEKAGGRDPRIDTMVDMARRGMGKAL